MKKSRFIIALSSLLIAALPNSLFAEEPTELLAYNASQNNNPGTVDDDILAAMQALDEVGAMLDTNSTSEKVDVDDIVKAASNDTAKKESQPETKSQTAAASKPTIATSFRIDDVLDSPQTAPANPAKDVKEAAPKTEKQDTVVAKAETKVDAPKHNIQTAPANPAKDVKEAAPKAEKQDTVVAKAETKVDAPKHNIQTAPANPAKDVKEAAPKTEKQNTVVAKAETKVDAPKHNIQTAPANPAKEVKEAAAKTEKQSTVIAKSESKPAQKSVTADGIHTTTAAQAGKPQPELSPATAPQSLSMAYAMAIYQVNGVDLTQASAKHSMPSIAELYQYAFEKKLVYQSNTPAIGDLVFFHNTIDRNRDGRWNDWHTLVGIVESIDSNQTISILIYRTDHIERISMNLKYPELDKNKKGQILNSQLRPNEGAQKGTTSKLFAGFANLLGNATSVTVIDNWKPGMKIK